MGTKGPHFMNSQFMSDLESGVVQYLGIYSRRNPAHLKNPLRKKTRVQLADLLKVMCEDSLFSAPRQLLSVVEGREVIVINIKKIRPVISELMIYFFPTEHPDLSLTGNCLSSVELGQLLNLLS